MRLHQRVDFLHEPTAGGIRELPVAQEARVARRIALDEFNVTSAGPGAAEEGDIDAALLQRGHRAVEDQLGAAEGGEALAHE